MNIVVVSDHAGFTLKEDVKTFLESEGHNVIDCGTYSKESCDYPDYANTAALAILESKAERGIFICGTGIGISIAANRHKGTTTIFILIPIFSIFIFLNILH